MEFYKHISPKTNSTYPNPDIRIQYKDFGALLVLRTFDVLEGAIVQVTVTYYRNSGLGDKEERGRLLILASDTPKQGLPASGKETIGRTLAGDISTRSKKISDTDSRNPPALEFYLLPETQSALDSLKKIPYRTEEQHFLRPLGPATELYKIPARRQDLEEVKESQPGPNKATNEKWPIAPRAPRAMLFPEGNPEGSRGPYQPVPGQQRIPIGPRLQAIRWGRGQGIGYGPSLRKCQSEEIRARSPDSWERRVESWDHGSLPSQVIDFPRLSREEETGTGCDTASTDAHVACGKKHESTRGHHSQNIGANTSAVENSAKSIDLDITSSETIDGSGDPTEEQIWERLDNRQSIDGSWGMDDLPWTWLGMKKRKAAELAAKVICERKLTTAIVLSYLKDNFLLQLEKWKEAGVCAAQYLRDPDDFEGQVYLDVAQDFVRKQRRK